MAKYEFKDKEYEKFETAFIARLVTYRRAMGLSQKDMSERLGCSKTHVCNIENGHTKISGYLLMKWCYVLNISPSEMLGYRSDEEMTLLIERIRGLTPTQFKVIWDMVRELKEINDRKDKRYSLNDH